MKDMNFQLKPVEEKPSRKYSKKSKYDPIIDKFLELNQDIAKVEVREKDPNYLRTQLKKRIDIRGIGETIEATVVNGNCYLEVK